MTVSDETSSARPRVRIIHETDPEKYYPALMQLHLTDQIEIVGLHRYSVLKEWLRAGLARQRTVGTRTGYAVRDLLLRLRILTLRDEVIVFGWAPWDWRLAVYYPLVRRNRIVYHTSWPRWGIDQVPRTYSVMTPLARWLWLRFLRNPHVSVVAVLPSVRNQVLAASGVDSAVIPHAVPDEFFEAATHTGSSGRGIRLVFVGELSNKKGVPQTLHLLERMIDLPVHLTLVGSGPLASACSEAANRPNVEYVGPIADKAQLAHILAASDVLLLLSQHQQDWEELFGIVIVEAIAAGLGVIASNHIGPTAIFSGTSLHNLFEDSDLEGVERLIRRLCDSPKELEAFKRGHRHLAAAYKSQNVEVAWHRIVVEGSRRLAAEPSRVVRRPR